ncbi:ankyrin repeat-containing domain protein [Cunninghamella echinulata]|nr:ankyrin repeat-containing domain protein [Cunninghamella echinulata]
MISDQREEGLREVCALGNIKAVQHYIQAGVNLNSQNKMNGWTALHWASHRGQEDIVRLLLSNGANTSLKTNKGQTALDLCNSDKYPNVKTMLEAQQVEATNIGPEPELPITPTYLKEPDLEKSWLLPDEFSENKVDRVIRQQTALDMMQNENNPNQQQQPIVSPSSNTSTKNVNNEQEIELLVYLGAKSDDSILGSVYLKNEPLNGIFQTLDNELDDLPEKFTIARNNGKVTIPISSKQMLKNVSDVFRNSDDVLIIVPTQS